MSAAENAEDFSPSWIGDCPEDRIALSSTIRNHTVTVTERFPTVKKVLARPTLPHPIVALCSISLYATESFPRVLHKPPKWCLTSYRGIGSTLIWSLKVSISDQPHRGVPARERRHKTGPQNRLRFLVSATHRRLRKLWPDRCRNHATNWLCHRGSQSVACSAAGKARRSSSCRHRSTSLSHAPWPTMCSPTK